MKECTRCLFTEDVATIMDDGQCEYCKLHDKLEAQSTEFAPVLQKIKRSGRKYDCLIGISGGVDSSTLLYAAVIKWGLNPYVIHFDNGYNKPEAEENMRNLCRLSTYSGVKHREDISFERIKSSEEAQYEYQIMNMALLNYGLPDADIPNDIAMTKIMYKKAKQLGIKYILNGHDFRTEGSSPKGWSLIDSEYLASVYEKFTGRKAEHFPFFTKWDNIKYGLCGIKQVRPFHFKDVPRKELESEMRKMIRFVWYAAKHGENNYTEYVGSFYLPFYHNIDKRLTYLSAQMRSGDLTRKEAKRIIENNKYNLNTKYFKQLNWYVGVNTAQRSDFKRTNFKKHRLIFWIAAKLRIVPYTFYAKYCK